MIYYLYAIKSELRKYTYIGITNDIKRRLNEHNSGQNRTTKPYRPFKILHIENFPDRISARAREKWCKTGEGREFLKNI